MPNLLALDRQMQDPRLDADSWNKERDARANILNTQGYDEAYQAAYQTAATRGRPIQASPTSFPTPVTGIANEWPQFANEDERQLALANGSYDPTFVSPYKKALYQAQQLQRATDLQRLQNYQVTNNPMPVISAEASPEDNAKIRAAQVAGDYTGTAMKILRTHAGMDPNDISQLPPPYLVRQGNLPSDDPTKDRLDRETYNHPAFRELMASNPNQAAFVYQRLHGRDLASDMKDATAFANDRAKFAQGLKDKSTEEQINRQIKMSELPMDHAIEVTKEVEARGGHYDPKTGQLKTWQNVMPDSATEGIISDQPVRKLLPASPETEMAWRKGYPAVYGFDAPPKPTVDPNHLGFLATLAKFSQDQQANIQRVLDQATTRKGAALTTEEEQQFAAKAIDDNRPLILGKNSRFNQAADATGAFVKDAIANSFKYNFNPIGH